MSQSLPPIVHLGYTPRILNETGAVAFLTAQDQRRKCGKIPRALKLCVKIYKHTPPLCVESCPHSGRLYSYGHERCFQEFHEIYIEEIGNGWFLSSMDASTRVFTYCSLDKEIGYGHV